MERAKITLSQDELSWKFSGNTLIINYKKPKEILSREENIRKELEKLNKKNFEEGDLECTTQ